MSNKTEINNKEKEVAVVALWDIIDDIDTYSDIIKPTTLEGYKTFYQKVMKLVQRRHKYNKFIFEEPVSTQTIEAPIEND